jgi:chromosome segregation ATPase
MVTLNRQVFAQQDCLKQLEKERQKFKNRSNGQLKRRTAVHTNIPKVQQVCEKVDKGNSHYLQARDEGFDHRLLW